MSYFMLQATYSPDAWGAMTKSPEDRMEAIRPVLQRLGGKVINGYLSFGQFDVVVIVEMPTDVSAAAFAMASAGSGAIQASQITPLLTMEEATQAMTMAASAEYAPPMPSEWLERAMKTESMD